MAKAAIDNKSSVESDPSEVDASAASLLLEVLHDLDIEPKEACEWMECDRPRFTRFKTGEARPTLEEVMRLPDFVWLKLRRRIDAAKGITTLNEDEVFAKQAGQLLTSILMHRFSKRRADLERSEVAS